MLVEQKVDVTSVSRHLNQRASSRDRKFPLLEQYIRKICTGSRVNVLHDGYLTSICCCHCCTFLATWIGFSVSVSGMRVAEYQNGKKNRKMESEPTKRVRTIPKFLQQFLVIRVEFKIYPRPLDHETAITLKTDPPRPDSRYCIYSLRCSNVLFLLGRLATWIRLLDFPRVSSLSSSSIGFIPISTSVS